MPIVSIVKGEDPYIRTMKALEMLDDLDLPAQARVLVKFNLAPYFLFHERWTGVDPRAVHAIVDFLKNHGMGDIVVGEGPAAGEKVSAGFEDCGYTALCRDLGLRLVDLDAEEGVDVSIPDGKVLRSVKIAKTAAERDFCISVAVLRVHSLCLVSLCMKNLMGILTPPKGFMHDQFGEKICDLCSLIKPKLSVIDGSIGQEGRGPPDAGPIRMDVTVAGIDVVAVDAVGAAIMGLQPERVPYLKRAQERGLGTCDLGKIQIVGEPIESVRRPFKIPF
jgi:uncharacterized protein (DUF362 family)